MDFFVPIITAICRSNRATTETDDYSRDGAVGSGFTIDSVVVWIKVQRNKMFSRIESRNVTLGYVLRLLLSLVS